MLNTVGSGSQWWSVLKKKDSILKLPKVNKMLRNSLHKLDLLTPGAPMLLSIVMLVLKGSSSNESHTSFNLGWQKRENIEKVIEYRRHITWQLLQSWNSAKSQKLMSITKCLPQGFSTCYMGLWKRVRTVAIKFGWDSEWRDEGNTDC